MNPRYEGGEILNDIELSLPNYSSHVVSLLLNGYKLKSSQETRIMDFGAGRGTLARLVYDRTGVKPICVELDPTLTGDIKKEGFQVLELVDSIPKASLDFIYTSNVLEHIEFDKDILQILANKLRQNGTIAVYVPAFPILFSNLDLNVGHFRRYKRADLIEKLSGAGFEVIQCNYNDSLGFLATLLLKLFRFRFNSSGEATVLMRIYDQLILPVSKLLDFIGCRYVFGKNLIAIARSRN
jgi:SAM-dependent methyltransferase